MVTNRLLLLDLIIGRRQQHVGLKTEENGESSVELVSEKLAQGPFTWYLYTSYARMEHRLNHSAEIAAQSV
jgi:hypothetical protein